MNLSSGCWQQHTITMSASNVRAKGTKGSAPATGTQTSPRITRNPYASGSASGLGPAPVTSGGIYAKAKGVVSYADEYVPPHPARSLSFATPQVGQGSQSLKKNLSTTNLEKNAIQLLPSHPSERRKSRLGMMTMRRPIFKMAHMTRTLILSPSQTRRLIRLIRECQDRMITLGMILAKA
jgi:hypothetical protein